MTDASGPPLTMVLTMVGTGETTPSQSSTPHQSLAGSPAARRWMESPPAIDPCSTRKHFTRAIHSGGFKNMYKQRNMCNTIIYYTILYYTILHYITLYYITLYYIILHYIITLYHIIICYIILHYIKLYYIISYYIIFYYIIWYYIL